MRTTARSEKNIDRMAADLARETDEEEALPSHDGRVAHSYFLGVEISGICKKSSILLHEGVQLIIIQY